MILQDKSTYTVIGFFQHDCNHVAIGTNDHQSGVNMHFFPVVAQKHFSTVEHIWTKMSTIDFMCALRYEIEEGLKRLRDVSPAGETYMHEGIKEVSLLSQINQITAQ